MNLAPYAVQASNTRGRHVQESTPSDGRSEFARDRDRIIHSAAFRRLAGKTQVFTMASERLQAHNRSDHFRNRLTHSLEVAQVSRSIARALSLNEDLSETLALAHDLGHAPFGHEGQHELNALMSKYGGFEHNIQSLRTVDVLERRYAKFNGLNLMFETREGILKHCSPKNARILGDVGERHLSKKSATLEAQVTDLSDAIAYTCHDIDDGLRSGLINVDDLMSISIFAKCWDMANSRCHSAGKDIIIQETLRDVLGLFVRGAIATSRFNIEHAQIKSLDDVRNAGDLIALPPDLAAEHASLKRHMFEVLYHHPRISEIGSDIKNVLNTLFTAYMLDFDRVPQEARQMLNNAAPQNQKARVVCDYIAGMTDSFAFENAKELKPFVEASKALLDVEI